MVELGSLGAEHTAARFFFEKKTLESRGCSSHYVEKTRALNDGFGKNLSRQRQRRACEARSFHGLEGLKFGSINCFDSEIWSASSSLGYAIKG